MTFSVAIIAVKIMVESGVNPFKTRAEQTATDTLVNVSY